MDAMLQRNILLRGSSLSVLTKALEQTIMHLIQEPWYRRNPYIHSSKVKCLIEEMDDLIEQIIHTILDYSALLGKACICEDKELHAYYYVYQFLFSFQDEIRRQENIHLLLIRNASLIEQFEHFFNYTKRFVDYQSQKLANL